MSSAWSATPRKAKAVEALGCELAAGDLGDEAAIRAGMEGCDAVIHAAAMYEVGIPASQRRADARGQRRRHRAVLGAALEAKIPRVVYVSTVGIFGNTHGKIVDESYEHRTVPSPPATRKPSGRRTRSAKRLIGEGLPCVIVQPGGVYGPGDTSSIAELLNQFLAGKMPLMPVPRPRYLPRPTSRTSPPASSSPSTRARRERPT